MTRIDRRALFATGSAAALLAAVGVSARPGPERGGHLRVALSGGSREDTWFDVPGGRFLQAARNAVFETLTELAPEGTLSPGLAINWHSEDGGRRWVFTLRAGVLFHDGNALTPEDVIASLPDFEVNTFGSHGVSFVLDKPDPSFPMRLSDGGFSIFSSRELASGKMPKLGTGPYRIVRFDPGRGFLGKRVEPHHKDGGAAWFDTVELVAISDDAVRAEAVRDGFVDAADLNSAFDLSGRDDLDLVLQDGRVQAVIRKTLTHPPRIGPHPLDALHFATRWWVTA